MNYGPTLAYKQHNNKKFRKISLIQDDIATSTKTTKSKYHFITFPIHLKIAKLPNVNYKIKNKLIRFI